MSDITRKQAILYLQDIIGSCYAGDTYEMDEDTLASIKIAINSLQIDEQYDLMYEQAEPKTGHWKKIQSGDKDFPESIVCSRCGHENSYLDFGISSVPIGKSFKKSKYCPNCGARMAESEGRYERSGS